MSSTPSIRLPTCEEGKLLQCLVALRQQCLLFCVTASLLVASNSHLARQAILTISRIGRPKMKAGSVSSPHVLYAATDMTERKGFEKGYANSNRFRRAHTTILSGFGYFGSCKGYLEQRDVLVCIPGLRPDSLEASRNNVVLSHILWLAL
ncbi:hypothetical protein F5Y13DRAFT_175239 [Hypoxylon sp. FL1857]|nr:hypothetical protein F5Y13DRAFT_175239 [Hypoxylon sp. FL1857]